MMKHTNCAHPSTKSARAKCRRDAAKFDALLGDVIDECAAPSDDDAIIAEIEMEEMAIRAGFESFDAMIDNDCHL